MALAPIPETMGDARELWERKVGKGASFINFEKKNRDQHVTAYETYTITCIADLKQIAAAPRRIRQGIPGEQTWIGRGRHTPRGERDVAPRRLRGATTSSCPKSEV